MEFKKGIKANYGDQIRVNRGLYYHYGIYCDENKIIQFGSPTNELDPNTAEVMIVNLSSFLRNDALEVRVLDEEEKVKSRTPDKIVEYATSRLGEKGYNILTNNCEHFVNECTFGVKESEQVSKVMSLFKDLFNIK